MFKKSRHGEHDQSGNDRSQQSNICKPKMGRDQMSGEVSVLCWHVTPIEYAPRRQIFCNEIKLCYKLKSGENVISCRNV